NILLGSCDGGSEEGGGNGSNSGPDMNLIEPLFRGAIQGTVTSSAGFPLNGVHVRAVRVDDTNIQISAFSGIGRNLTFRDGEFRIDGVPAGNYRILIERLDGRSPVFQDFRYSDFVTENSPLISFPDEYFNGADESSNDDPQDSVEVRVVNGQTAGGINFITND
ncbi:MAG: carboxypeptidase regulatory-like domain-containing protein, partial [Deltaproteobacteria bacterium]|nr:carboxypeptidase regulatory-like domain-containing protein [Deltaproteobacteria bacterium]